MSFETTWLENAASAFDPRPVRWPRPGHLAKHIDSRIVDTPALQHIDDELVSLLGGVRRLMVFMPPQEGKSQRCSRTFPTWLLEQDPTLRIAIVSYEAEIATRWGRDIKLDLEQNPEIGIELRTDSRAAGRWETVQGGGIVCAGIGSALTGRPVDVLIIDDPVKDRADAESKVMRDRNWDWWESVGSLRLSRRGSVVLMMTRWHDDDLAGRLLKREPNEWRVVKIPAIATSVDDPLGRQLGEELLSATKEPGHYTKQKSLRSPYVWSSVFQQSPSKEDGGLFKRGDWRFWEPLSGKQLRLGLGTVDLRDCTRFATVDLATSTKTSADWTVVSIWAISPSGDLILLDRARKRVSEESHFELVQAARSRWHGPYDVVYVESRMFGTTLVYAAGQSGIPIQELKADVDKFTRALPASDLVRQHRVWIPGQAPWLDEWLDEHAEFPTGTHDDQVDTTAYAARVAFGYWIPPEPSTVGPVGPEIGGLDFMSVQY